MGRSRFHQKQRNLFQPILPDNFFEMKPSEEWEAEGAVPLDIPHTPWTLFVCIAIAITIAIAIITLAVAITIAINIAIAIILIQNACYCYCQCHWA